MWTIGVLENKPQKLLPLFIELSEIQSDLDFVAVSPAWLREMGEASALDALIVGPDGIELPPVTCRIAVLPGQTPLPVRASCVLTYGLSSKESVTISSMDETKLALALQRDLINVKGERVERQEFLVPRLHGFTREEILALWGGLLAVGYDLSVDPLIAGREPALR